MSPQISVIVPAYEEAARIRAPLRRIFEYFGRESIDGEIIVVDDGSRDKTAETAESVISDFRNIDASVVRYQPNRGKGHAVRTGLKAARAEIALFTDADLSTPIEELPKLVEPIRNDDYDVTFGSRAIDRSLIGTHQPWRREQGGKVMNLIIRTMTGLPFSDTQCGFKAFNMKRFRPLVDLMTIDRFGFDVEFLFVAKYHGLRLKEIPVRWDNVEGSKVNVFRDTGRMFTELSEIRKNAKSGRYDVK
jgi:glycosyltransferase involved in cell wall biosynthesis